MKRLLARLYRVVSGERLADVGPAHRRTTVVTERRRVRRRLLELLEVVARTRPLHE